MGVKDLWKILECAGHPVTLESLEGLILAVGVWLHVTRCVYAPDVPHTLPPRVGGGGGGVTCLNRTKSASQ